MHASLVITHLPFPSEAWRTDGSGKVKFWVQIAAVFVCSGIIICNFIAHVDGGIYAACIRNLMHIETPQYIRHSASFHANACQSEKR